MKLPNFFYNKALNSIRSNMGIEKNYKTNFDGIKYLGNGVKLTLAQVEALEMGQGIDISINDISIGEDSTLKYGNKNVILYMRDQFHPLRSPYKYHVAWCDTMQKRKDDRKLSRYVISRRTDGMFNVNIFVNHKLVKENALQEIKVCKDCLKKLNYKGFAKLKYSNPKRERIYEEFSIEEFLDKQYKGINDYDGYTSTTAPKNEYPSNWNEISRAYRQKQRWKCEACNKDCTKNRKKLHVHHINSNKWDVCDKNLIALCEECHKKEHI